MKGVYHAETLYFWLRLYAIPGKTSNDYPDGMLLSREDANLIGSSVGYIFGNFIFLKPGIGIKETKMVAEAFERAGRIFWRRDDYPLMGIVKDPKTYVPLHQCLLGLLARSQNDNRGKEEIERLAEYFVILCQGNRSILKKLAMLYHSETEASDRYKNFLPSDD